MWSRFFGLMAAIVCAAGCASGSQTAASEVAMIVWPQTDAPCDFEQPDRGTAWAISTSPTQTAMLRNRGGDTSSTTYVVRDVQLLSRPREGDRFCVAVLRGLTLGRKDAVFGFEGRLISNDAAELSPVYSRLGRAANGANRPVIVRIAFGAGVLSGGRATPAGEAEFDFGSVGSRAARPHSGPGVLSLPPTRQGGLTRLVAVVEEAPLGAAPKPLTTLIGDTLNQADHWD